MKIVYETHSTTLDNEAGRSSGWNDVALSKLGEQQAREIGSRYKVSDFDVICAADLVRTRQTVELAFPNIDPTKLRLDWRLREINYGDMTLQPSEIVDAEKPRHISEPFPNGESYVQAIDRVRRFLEDLKQEKFENVLIIDSRATHYALDHLLGGKSIEEAVTTKLVWQPGWEYELK